MRLLLYIVFGVLISGLGYNLYISEVEKRAMLADLSEVAEKMKELEKENEELSEEIEYFSNPHNLEKELRARYNYRAPNEDLIIVVPEEEN